MACLLAILTSNDELCGLAAATLREIGVVGAHASSCAVLGMCPMSSPIWNASAWLATIMY